LDGLTLDVSVCEWDDTVCLGSGEGFILNRTYVLQSIPPGEKAAVDVSFKAPERPNAYAIRLELKDAGGRMVSLYRSRIIVKGETARIRKMAVNNYHYSGEEPGSIMLLIGPSPDHYTNPVTKDAEARVSIVSDGKTLYSESSSLPPLSGLSYPVTVFVSFNFSAPVEMNVFEVCSQINSRQEQVYDRYCYMINSSRFVVESCGDGRCGAGEDSANCCVDCICPAPMKCITGACQIETEDAAAQATTTEALQAPETTAGTLSSEKTGGNNSSNPAYHIALLVVLFFAVVLCFIFMKKSRANKK